MEFADARRFLLALPGVTEEPHFEARSARVGGKMIATWAPDGGWFHLFLAPERIGPACVALAAEPVTWGGKALGVKVTFPADAEALLLEAWRRRAPKRVVAGWEARRADG